jgi:hypothetical protein
VAQLVTEPCACMATVLSAHNGMYQASLTSSFAFALQCHSQLRPGRQGNLVGDDIHLWMIPTGVGGGFAELFW